MNGAACARALVTSWIVTLAGCMTTGVEGQDRAAPAIVGTPWVLVSLEGQAPSAGPAVTLRLEPDGTLGGSDGCNRYSGRYELEGEELALPGPLVGTQMACPEPAMSRARAYTTALENVARASIEGDHLALRDAGGKEVAMFEPQSLDLAGSAWQVVAYNNGREAVVSVIVGTEITLRFGADGRVTGNASCNQYFASYAIAGETISVGTPGATRRFCGEPAGRMEQETGFLAALESATHFRVEGEALTLLTSSEATAVTLTRDRSAETATPDAGAQGKIRFDLDRVDADGLQGPPDGLRALHYEYCIPDRSDVVAAVTGIDSTAEIQRGSRGRVGCGNSELLCLGSTHQPNYRIVLARLAALPEVAEIREAFFE